MHTEQSITSSNGNTELVAKIRELIEAGYSRKLVAKALGISHGRVSGIVYRNGIKKRPNAQHKRLPSGGGKEGWTPEQTELLRRMFFAGHTQAFMAWKLNKNYKTVASKLARMGLKRKARATNRKKKEERRAMRVERVIEIIPPDPAKAIRLVEARGNQCRWPLDEPSADMTVCGCNVAVGSYCGYHWAQSRKTREEAERDRQIYLNSKMGRRVA